MSRKIHRSQLAKWEELSNKASPPPWDSHSFTGTWCGGPVAYSLVSDHPVVHEEIGQAYGESNRDFFIAARVAVPCLVKRVRELESALASIKMVALNSLAKSNHNIESFDEIVECADNALDFWSDDPEDAE